MKKRILITGTGGPAGIGALRALADSGHELVAADMSEMASGLFLVPRERRVLLRPGAHPQFVPQLMLACAELGIDTVLPTVDAELLPLAEASRDLRSRGIELVAPGTKALRTCLDKFQLFVLACGHVPCPRTALFGRSFDPNGWRFPLIVKPRRGSGSRGVIQVQSERELRQLERSPDLIVQQFLPGMEYSVDVLAQGNGEMLVAVPRSRLATDSGVSVCSQTHFDPELIELARRACEIVGLRFVANVQFKRDASGRPKLMEINPRIPGTIGLTVAAGTNLPALSLDVLDGHVIPKEALKFRELAVVRMLTEVFVDPSEFQQCTRPEPLQASA